jgi:hypothetical protein
MCFVSFELIVFRAPYSMANIFLYLLQFSRSTPLKGANMQQVPNSKIWIFLFFIQV